ncbi:TlpA family protein disulfide reductase [Sphingobacterium faecium]|uniref:TlpA family protein disulfide reductase n=1 Tax=Sphingobacterium faecium TaxID=34087 RepID=UPI0011B29611|nr:hypothetical protein [Sphingobacterium faecium]
MQKVVFKVAKSVPLVYGVFTGSVPILYRECTEKLLRRYQRATKASSLTEDLQAECRPAWEHRCYCISQACVVHMLSNGQAWIVRKTVPIDTRSMHDPCSIYASSILDRCVKNASFQISAFKRFNLFSQVYGWFCINNAPNLFKSILNRSLASSIDAVVQHTHSTIMKTGRAFSLLVLLFFNLLDCVLTELKSIRTYSLLVLMFSMFSLSAQTPRKDSGADGQIAGKPLLIGQKLPDEFWNKEFLFFRDGDTLRRTLEEYKNKMIILDFWSSGCTPCLLHQKEIRYFADAYQDDLVVIMVNSKLTREKYGKLRALYDKGYFQQFGMKNLESIIEDDYLVNLFAATAFPNYIWINNIGRLQLKTYKNLLDRNYVAPFIEKP